MFRNSVPGQILALASIAATAVTFPARVSSFMAPFPPPTTTMTTTTRLHASKLFSDSVYDTIANGQIAVLPNFLNAAQVDELQRDASDLWHDGYFTTDALASYGTKGKYNPAKERAVLKLAQWKNEQLGSTDVRHAFEQRMQDLRTDLAHHLNRPKLLYGASVEQYGRGSTEISYTRFGPGASLARHVDEHHEECKGATGWSTPTRRSLSWIIYLNNANWKAERDGGCLRCFQRKHAVASSVGARGTGDLQIGWLRATVADPVDRPVFLNAQHHDGNCAMYVDSTATADGRQYITKTFPSHPTLFLSSGERLLAQALIPNPSLAARFHFLEPPKSALTQSWTSLSTLQQHDETVLDVEPVGGTLVIFDSVSLPHEVLPTIGRERWATSGWFHEDQQPVDSHPLYVPPENVLGGGMAAA